MTTNTVLLCDGSMGTTVSLWDQGKTTGIPSAGTIGDRIWLLWEGSTFITIRSSENGEVIKKVDLFDEGVSLQVISSMEGNLVQRVWVSATSAKVYIFMEDGSLLGIIQEPGSPMVTKIFPMPLESGNILFTSGQGKDVTMWDSQHFKATTSYFGKTPGEVVTGVSPCDSESVVFCVSTTHSIRLFSRRQADVVASIETTGASAIFVDYSFTPCNFVSSDHVNNSYINSNSILVGYVWAAQRSAVTIYAIVMTGNGAPKGDLPHMTLIQSNILPCPDASQIIRSAPSRVSIVSSDGMISIWSMKTFSPFRTFKAGNALDIDYTNGVPNRDGKKKNRKGHFKVIPILTKLSRLFWTLSDGDKALLWSDTVVLPTEAEISLFDVENCEKKPKIQSTASGGSVGGMVTGGVPKDMEKEEIIFLRKKLKYLETISTLYRQKIGTLFRQNAPPISSAHSKSEQKGEMQFFHSFEEIDKAYEEVFARYEQQALDQEPMPQYLAGRCSNDNREEPEGLSESFIDYWKRKYHSALADMEQMNCDYESIIEYYGSKPLEKDDDISAIENQSTESPPFTFKKSIGSDGEIPLAMYVCQLIREKNSSLVRDHQLIDEIAQLRGALRKCNTPQGSSANNDYETLNTTLREEVKKLKRSLGDCQVKIQNLEGQGKQCVILKSRMKKMQIQHDEREVLFSNRTADMQSDIDRVVEKLYSAKNIIEVREKELRNAEKLKGETDLLIVKKDQDIEILQRTIDKLTKEAEKYQLDNDDTIGKLKDEIRNLSETQNDRERKIAEWNEKYDSTSCAVQEMEMKLSSSKFLIESRDSEISFMTERIARLESILQDREMYASTVSEIQKQIEVKIEELRSSACEFSTLEFPKSIEKLEDRMAILLNVEHQLKHKDDVIALKDDELQLIRDNYNNLQHKVTQISSIFLQLPKSIEEVERMTIELDEYRSRFGCDPSVRSIIQDRLVSLQTKQRSNNDNDVRSKVMDLLYVGNKQKFEGENSVERAQALAETLKAIANRSLKVVKNGHHSTVLCIEPSTI